MRKSDLLDMVGWITMNNQSGKTFENAHIKLLAGDVNKIQAPFSARNAMPREAKAMNDAALAPVVSEKSFDEFHLYTLAAPDHLARPGNQASGICGRERGFMRSASMFTTARRPRQYGYYNPEQIRQDPGYGTASNPKVWVMEEFKNSDTNHLGIALPKGRLRFYRRDTDGHLEFVGENTIDHTPKDETIRVYTGNAFDVVGRAQAHQLSRGFKRSTGWTNLSRFVCAITRKKR